MTENPKSKIHTALRPVQGNPKSTVFFWQRLRWNLTIASVILAVLPVVLVSFFTLTRLSEQAERQFIHQLEGIATLKQDQITRWLEDSGYILDLIWAEDDHRQALIAVVAATLDPASSPDEAQLNHVNRLLAETAKAQALFEEFLLYNAQGRVIAASDPNQIGKILNRRPYFANSLERNFIQPPYYEVGVEGITMFMTRPLSGSNGQAVGALAGRLDMKTLGQIMTERTGLGQTGETYLVSPESHYLVTPSHFTEQGYSLTQAYYSEGINWALQGKNGSGLYNDYRTSPVPVIGVYRWLPDLQVAFLAEIDQAEALAPFIEIRNFSLSIAVVATLFALLIGLYTATLISRPVAELTRTARQIAAGDLTKQARISRLYEIGSLASAFNTMTLRLRGLIDDLEQRYSELQQAQQTLQASEARSRALINGIPDMIFRITSEGLFLDFKAEPTDLAMPAEEIIGSNLNFSPLPSPVVAELLRLTRLAIETNQLQTYEYELPMPSGLQIYETRVVKSGPNEAIHVVRNITERTQMGKSLRESEERYARMVRGSSDGVWDWDILTGEDYLSPRWKEILGYEDKELPNVEASFFDLLHPDDKPRVNGAIERHLKEQTPYHEEIRLLHKDGTYRWVLTRGEAVHDDEGRPIRMAGSITDITERKQAEESLAKSEARLAEAQRIAHVGSWERNMQTDTGYWSEEHYWIFGLTPQKVAPSLETFLSFVHPDDRSLIHQSLQELAEQGNSADMSTYRIVRPDGEVRVIDSRREVTFDEAGRLLRVAGIIQDVTERKQAEETLRTHSQILQAMAEGVNFVDTQGIIRYTNPAFDQMFGYEPGELLGQPVSLLNALSPKENGHFIASILTTLHNGQPWEGEVTNRKKDGTLFYTYARISTMHQGDEVWSVTVQEDITERKQAEGFLTKSEARLAEAQRIAHVGSWERNMQTDTAYWSEEHFRIFGLSPQEVILPLKTFLNFVHPDDRSLVRQALQEFPEQRNSADAITYRIVRPDGEIRIIDSRREFTFDEAGRLLRVAGIIQDVTERKRAEQELREAHQLLGTIFDHTHIMVAYMDAEFNFIQVNRAYAQADDQEPSYFPSKNHFELYPHPENEAIFRRVVETKEAYFEFAKPFEYAEHPDRSISHWDWSLVPVKDANETVTGVILTLQDVTERIRAEELLKEQEMLMEIFFSQSLDGFFFMMLDKPVRWHETVDKEQVLDYVFAHQRVTKVNDALLAQYGTTREQFLGLTPGDFFAHDIPQGKAAWRSFLDQGRMQIKTDGRKFDGSSMWVEGEYVCIYDYQGRIMGHFGIQREITDQVQAEETLRQSEATLAEAQRIARLGNWDWNVKTQDFYWSDEIYRIFGLTPQEFEPTYEAFVNIVHPADRKSIRKAVDQALADKTPYSVDYRIVLPNGEVRIVHEQGEVITDEQDQPIRMLGTVQDITERKQAEEALRESEARMRLVVENLPVMVDAMDENNNIIVWNRECERVTGYSAAEIIGNPAAFELLYPDPAYREKMFDSIAHLNGDFRNQEWRLVCKKGIVKTVAWSTVAERFPIPGWKTWAVGVDITERKLAEQKLIESEKRYRTLFTQSPDGIMLVDPETTRAVEFNPAIARLLGYSNQEFARLRVADYDANENPAEIIAQIEKVLRDGHDVFETRLRTKGGDIKEVQANIQVLELSGRTIFHNIIHDLTERKQAEEQIKAALYEKEALLKEIHHRVKNNMQIISSLLDLQADMIQDKQVHDLFKESQQRIRSMALIHERLYQSQNLAQIDFLEYVTGLTDYLLHSYGAMAGNITLDLDIAPLLLSIETAIPCGLIINELVSNAFKHAFPNGKSGKIHIRLSAIDHLLILQIQDDGIGFPAKLNPHRTESLGLTLVATLVHQLKATIEMKNNNGVQIEIVFSDPTVKAGD